MKTPVFDFVKSYADRNAARFHMPGHKGRSFLGCESLDITEIDGADVLYSAGGIIEESENNASSLFSSLHSFYSTEGSTLCIKAMLTLVCKHSEGRPLILAARNVHKAFVYAGAILDFDVQWLTEKNTDHLCVCRVTKEDVEKQLNLSEKKPSAVYITSPDYLGNVADIKGISEVCDSFGVPLLVDNAHGAYLHFLDKSLHPLALGATMCCDSAHKTLPVLTGGAYLHLSCKAEKYLPDARDALALHASTSPSYLILQSLDLCNAYLSGDYPSQLCKTAEKLRLFSENLRKAGFDALCTEPLKLTLNPLSYGYSGCEIASLMSEHGICCEFYDRDTVVLMATPENSNSDFSALQDFFEHLGKRPALNSSSLSAFPCGEKRLSLREAMLSPSEYVKAEAAEGRICAEPTVSCPPAVPIVLSGEVITAESIGLFKSYGIEKIKVVKK